ncbi:uncharacterized protein BCR38DRAFT_332331 [Pseudomassariella vexata]|uniref:DUF7729 domain-containing protein n=1 Tax=Pseudomassariella vexata TaxID=1141098 RepID=A0A1Y2EEU1_9PEZI|nr:uncharacterized protein BCR38DRAFT_332331 [Pseudomassariella vexata]ORY70092.1 hypothetical protein BCR38DRAFT_332331 [Pseudomassariella vexata]
MFPASHFVSRRRTQAQSRLPGRANLVVSSRPTPKLHLALIIALFFCWVSLTAAISHDRLPQLSDTLLVDTRVPVLNKDGAWVMMSQEEHRQLDRRHAANAVRAHSSPSTDVTTTIAIDVSTATAKPTQTTTAVSSPLPSPFDTALAANFSGTSGNCPSFINTILTNSTFKQCYPFSMLLQGSLSFFQAEKSMVSITQVLDATCEADSLMCADYLDGVATDLISEANCATDFAQENQVVMQAYLGLSTYAMLYSASCLTDPETDAYCFANAVTNLTDTSNVYLYFLPLNVSLPLEATPSCGWCTQQTMGIFQSASAVRTQPIALTYGGAADTVNDLCGEGFVNATLPAAQAENAALAMRQPPSLLLLIPLFAMALSHWLF